MIGRSFSTKRRSERILSGALIFSQVGTVEFLFLLDIFIIMLDRKLDFKLRSRVNFVFVLKCVHKRETSDKYCHTKAVRWNLTGDLLCPRKILLPPQEIVNICESKWCEVFADTEWRRRTKSAFALLATSRSTGMKICMSEKKHWERDCTYLKKYLVGPSFYNSNLHDSIDRL